MVEGAADVRPDHLDIVARWNDAKFARLGRSDVEFLHERLEQLRQSLRAADSAKRIIAAVHHLPFREMLPPHHNSTWDFVRAYLGSPKIGEVLASDPRVTDVLCGHAHLPSDQMIGRIRAINIGSGYRHKHFVTLDLP